MGSRGDEDHRETNCHHNVYWSCGGQQQRSSTGMRSSTCKDRYYSFVLAVSVARATPLKYSRPASKLSGALWRRGGKRKESLQLLLWNLNSAPNSPVAPRRLSCQISANQREAETSANLTNIEKHVKARAKGNDVTTNVISANQHFASTFSMQIFKFQRSSCKLSFLFPPRRQSAPARRACS